MVNTWKVEVPVLKNDVPRLAYVYLPESYKKKQGKRYPVLYMFDGHNVFFDSHATYGTSWGMKKYMDATKTEIIIAAVECNHSPDHGRLKEYSPYDFTEEGYGKIEGRGSLYMDWLIREFKPYIDKTYRTLPDREHTMIAGSSMGGLMSLYAVTNFNNVFSKAACLSPSLWFNEPELKKMLISADMAPDTVIYMDYGANEMGNHKKMREHYGRVITYLLAQNINLDTRIVPEGYHCEASWERQISFFMNTLLYNLVDTKINPFGCKKKPNKKSLYNKKQAKRLGGK